MKTPPEQSSGSRLTTYRAKRSAGETPEPLGRDGLERPGLFVVQKHAARNLHYDLRIEVDGVLKSWAVPKGPSFDPADKRFAVETEDHPIEYADFEGIIPVGNYGAGAMIVWDRGLCVPKIDHHEGFDKGKLLFELRGYKLRGLWTLVKTKGAREWLLIKERDSLASDKRVDDLGAESVFSGLTIEELRDGHSKASEIRDQLAKLGAPEEPVDPEKVKVMLVGSGFSDAQLTELRARLDADRRVDPPVAGAEAEAKSPDDVWVEPRIVIEVRYTEATESGQLRFPVFLRERTDKRVEDCVHAGAAPPPAEVETSPEPAPRPEVPFTNLDKVYWPEDGYTKGDLVDYYRAVWPRLSLYLDDRPVVLDRYPDGIYGKNFYQKHAPDFAPDWIRTETIWSEGDGSETEYFLCDDPESLLYLANLGSIPLHVWSSRFETLQSPDWSILDLDAKEAPFAYVVEVAQAIHRLCDSIELPSFAKTSGATGLHMLIPLGGKCTYAQSRQLAEVLARVVATEHQDLCTITRTVAKREGRVYLDYLQNGFGKLLVAPLSVRPRPGATVSTPLAWDEVTADLDPGAFTIETVPERLERIGDPLRPVLELEPDLTGILGRLAGKL